MSHGIHVLQKRGLFQGIGLEITKKLCQNGFKVVMGCRNEILGRQAEQQLLSNGFDVEFRQVDVSNQASVEMFANSLQESYSSLDVLVNNAGIYKDTPIAKLASTVVTTNYFSALWMSISLLTILKKSEAPKIVNVASELGHLIGIRSLDIRSRLTSETLSIDELSQLMLDFVDCAEKGTHLKQGWSSSAYNVSKVGMIALTKVLAREEPTVMINACCPGYCATDLTNGQGHYTAEQGARTPAMLACFSDKFITGGFYAKGAEIEW